MMQEATNIYVQPQQVVLSAGPDSASNIPYAHKHYRKWILGLGILEILVGIILIILGIVIAVNAKTVDHISHNNYHIPSDDNSISYDGDSISYVHPYYNYYPSPTHGEGIWGGLMVILAGILGIITGLQKGKWKSAVMMAHMVFSIIGSVIAFVVFVLAITTASFWFLNFRIFAELLFSLVAMALLIASTSFSSGFLGCLKTERLQFVYGGYVPYQPMREQEMAAHSAVGYASSSWNPNDQGQPEMAAYPPGQYATATAPWYPTDGGQPGMEPVQNVQGEFGLQPIA